MNQGLNKSDHQEDFGGSALVTVIATQPSSQRV